MKERPILYSAPMVLAKLAGRKTQTRRLVKPQPHLVRQFDGVWAGSNAAVNLFTPLKPYAEVGDRLWGRETFGATQLTLDDRHLPGIHYRATDEWPQRGPWPWRPSIFMPRWASRLLDEVVSVRVERLHDITEADAKAEGAAWRISPGGDLAGAFEHNDAPINYRAHYRDLWESINGPKSWSQNPWVWRVETKPAFDTGPF